MNYPKKNCELKNIKKKKEKRNWKNSTWSRRRGKGEKKKKRISMKIN